MQSRMQKNYQVKAILHEAYTDENKCGFSEKISRCTKRCVTLGKKKIKKKDEKTGEETEVEDYDWDAITKK